jgi:hypothetical protein
MAKIECNFTTTPYMRWLPSFCLGKEKLSNGRTGYIFDFWWLKFCAAIYNKEARDIQFDKFLNTMLEIAKEPVQPATIKINPKRHKDIASLKEALSQPDPSIKYQEVADKLLKND